LKNYCGKLKKYTQDWGQELLKVSPREPHTWRFIYVAAYYRGLSQKGLMQQRVAAG